MTDNACEDCEENNFNKTVGAKAHTKPSVQMMTLYKIFKVEYIMHRESWT